VTLFLNHSTAQPSKLVESQIKEKRFAHLQKYSLLLRRYTVIPSLHPFSLYHRSDLNSSPKMWFAEECAFLGVFLPHFMSPLLPRATSSHLRRRYPRKEAIFVNLPSSNPLLCHSPPLHLSKNSPLLCTMVP